MLDERVESAIDAAARQMTDGDLPPDFKARVLARIGSRDHRAWLLPSVWALSALGVAGIVMVAALTVRAPWRLWRAATFSPVSVAVRGTEAPYDGATTGGGAAARGEPIRGRPEPRTSNDLARSSAVTAGELAPAAIDIEPLGIEVMNSMEPQGLSIEAMDSIESIDVPGLALAPLEVPALVGCD